MSKMSMREAGRLGGLKTKQLWIDKYNNNPKLCKYCNEKLPYEKRKNTFCNQSCSASFNNKNVVRKIKEPKICLYCGVDINFKRYGKKYITGKYCGNECQQRYYWEIRKKTIEELQEEKSPFVAKRYLKETRGVQCEICKITKWCGQLVPLVMDHIDGNSENNKLSNLRLVCGNCDMQLPTYKSKNRGKGRHSRRQRYLENKSY